MHKYSNIVVWDQTLDTFRLFHLSVRESLEKQSEYTHIVINTLTAEIYLLNVFNTTDYSATKKLLSSYELDLSNSACFDGLERHSTVY
jgi:hypothetical protein